MARGKLSSIIYSGNVYSSAQVELQSHKLPIWAKTPTQAYFCCKEWSITAAQSYTVDLATMRHLLRCCSPFCGQLTIDFVSIDFGRNQVWLRT
jgi:hypothetical protein